MNCFGPYIKCFGPYIKCLGHGGSLFVVVSGFVFLQLGHSCLERSSTFDYTWDKRAKKVFFPEWRLGVWGIQHLPAKNNENNGKMSEKEAVHVQKNELNKISSSFNMYILNYILHLDFQKM